MKEYKEFPPIKYFLRVLKNCPESALLYIQLWKQRTEKPLFVQKSEIRKIYMISPTKFRNFLSPLAFLGLLIFKEADGEYQINSMGQDLNE